MSRNHVKSAHNTWMNERPFSTYFYVSQLTMEDSNEINRFWDYLRLNWGLDTNIKDINCVTFQKDGKEISIKL